MKYAAILAIGLLSCLPVQAQARNGLRADVHLGWDHPSIHATATDGVDSFSGTASQDGLLYGAEIGYDAKLSDFDLGIYGGLDGATTKACVSDPAVGEGCLKAGRSWNVGVRAGYFLAEGVLAYVKGGYSNGSIKLSYRDAVDPANDLSVSENMGGYHIGGGVQVALGPKIYAKLEYVRTNYDDYDYRGTSIGLLAGVDRDNLVYGMGFRF